MVNRRTAAKSIEDNLLEFINKEEGSAKIKAGRYNLIIEKKLKDQEKHDLMVSLTNTVELLTRKIYSMVEEHPSELSPTAQIFSDTLTMVIMVREMLELDDQILNEASHPAAEIISQVIMNSSEITFTILSAMEYAGRGGIDNEVAH